MTPLTDCHPLTPAESFWFAVQSRQTPVFGNPTACRVATIAAFHTDPRDDEEVGGGR